MASKYDLSVIMPCLNEENTVGDCIDEAKDFIKRAGLKAEIIVVDNNSTDKSADIAKKKGAKVIKESKKGYGCALRAGIEAAQGEVIIMGDCDMTYDFANLDEMYEALQKYDMVIGDRFKGGIEKGAMPWSHNVGMRGLSEVGRIRYGTKVHDFQCGIRGVRRSALSKMKLSATGMEFATEIIAEAKRKDLEIGQIPVPLRKREEGKKTALTSLKGGFRHLWFIIFK